MLNEKKTNQPILPILTLTQYSCALAETKNIKVLATSLETPLYHKGLYRCLMNH